MRTTLLMIGLCALLGGVARAGALDLQLGLDGAASGWHEDVGHGTLKLGWQFRPWLAVSFLGKEGYAAIDQRSLTYLSVGAEVRGRVGRTRPYLRLGLVHQHEEPLPAVEYQPFQSIFGVGDGIRHRAGADVSAGIELPFHRHRHGDFFAALSADATWLPDPRGPGWYASVGASVGFNYDFGARRD